MSRASRSRARRAMVAVVGLCLLATACSNSDDEDSGPRLAAPCAALGGLGPVASPSTAASSDDDPSSSRETAGAGEVGGPSDDAPIQVLVFTRTEGFRHDSIELAIDWFDTLGPDGIEATFTEETEVFTAEGLDDFDVVAFVSTTGDVLDDPEQAAFEEWLEGGGGFVGVHAATDTEYDWEWYGDAIGAWFTSHPFVFQTVTVSNEAPDDPSTAPFDETFQYTDEWYNFDRNARHRSDVLLTIDESSGTYLHNDEPVTEFTQGDDHPVSWSRQVGDGRVWYTALGHMNETWEDPAFQEHLSEGVRWAADAARYRRSVITEEVDAPVALAVADSGLVLWAERGGAVKAWDPVTSMIHLVGEVPTRVEGEGGLLGLRLAPEAAETGHLYVYATLPADEPDEPDATDATDATDGTNAPGPGGEAAEDAVKLGEGVDPDGIDDLLAAGEVGVNALLQVTLDADCTFTVTGDDEPLVAVPNQFTGHQGGDIQFLPDGTIVLSTGDNTDNIADGYAPLGGTDRADTVDARRTSGNPDDLRGKLLRINPDGTIPEGNLYPADGTEGRPEVYATGVRNPYRMAVHPETGRLWFGDIGPDAITPGERGPQGYDELNTVAEPGDYGWPFCIADNQPYMEHDLGTGETGRPFDCTDKVPATLAYDYAEVIDPALGAGFMEETYGSGVALLGRSLMAGPWYRPAEGASSALPFADTLLLHEFSRNLLLTAEVDDDGSVTSLRRIAPWAGINTPIDVEVGPDGALYIVEYGVWNDITSGSPAITRLEFSPTGDFPTFAPATIAPGSEVDDSQSVDGAHLYQFNCSSCHGNQGQGGIGPALPGVDERYSRAEITSIVTDGRQQMPAWGDRLTAEQIEALVAYVSEMADP